MGESVGAEQAQDQSAGEWARVSWEGRAIPRDISIAINERDYQAMGIPLLPAVWKFVAREVTATEIQPNGKAVYHLYPACPVGKRSIRFPGCS